MEVPPAVEFEVARGCQRLLFLPEREHVVLSANVKHAFGNSGNRKDTFTDLVFPNEFVGGARLDHRDISFFTWEIDMSVSSDG